MHLLIATLHARAAGAVLAAVLLLAGLAPQALAQTTYTVTVANKTAAHPYFGQGHPTAYRIDGAEAPPVTLVRGRTYTFQLSNVGAVHPFYLSTSPSGGGAGVYSDGVTGNFGTGNAVVTITVPANAPDELWYQCSNHGQMGWRMAVVNAPTPVPYATFISGANETPANSSAATGNVTATLTGNTLVVGGSFAGLSAAYTVSHLHLGAAGQNGPVQVALTPAVAADGRSGTVEAAANTFTLTADQVEALAARRLYSHIHSAARPGGEIRGQVSPASWVGLYAALTGRAEMPAGNPSQAAGGVLVEIRGLQAIATGAFAGLGSDFNTAVGAHLHLGGLGVNGPVVFPLTPALAADNRGGTFERAANTFTLTQEQADAFTAGGYYVNVHSVDRPSGEVRGQALSIATRTVEAWLVGANQAPPVASTATGGLIGVLDGLTLTVGGGFAGLASDLPAQDPVHIVLGAPGQNGTNVFHLHVAPGADLRSGTIPSSNAGNVFALTADQAAALVAGGFYVNVATTDRPAGEIRGQLLAAADLAPAVPVVTAPADGATLVLAGDDWTPVVVTWTASDPNANALVHSWQLARDAAFTDVVLASGILTEARFETTVGAVDALLASLGVEPGQSLALFHRARSRDGGFGANGAPTAITIQRRMVVAGETPAGAVTFAVGRNAPNPFSGTTTLAVDLPEAATVTVEVFDVLGRQMMLVETGSLPAGRAQPVRLNGSSLAVGAYVYRVRADGAVHDYTASGRMVRMK